MDLSTGLQEGLQRLGYQFVPFLIAVVVHEFGHGLVANLWGDSTAKDAGRLTLNPVPHIDLIGTLVFPIINMLSGLNILFGWAKPVPIDPRRFRNFRHGLFWVSLAGVMANFITAFLCALGLCLMVRFVQPDFMFFKEFTTMLQVGVYINFGLGFFNLIPLPPLDGSKVVESFISYPAMQKYEQLGRYSFFILLALMFTGAVSYLMIPITYLANLTLILAAKIVGIPFM
jgi:Zn-dependent protease